MSRFLGRLVQRSLTNRAGVRPRPVSLFEPPRPAPAYDVLRSVPLDREGGDHVRAHRQPTPAVDPAGRGAVAAESGRLTADAPTDVQVAPMPMTPPRRPNPPPGMTGKYRRGKPRERHRSDTGDNSAPAAVRTEVSARAPVARQTAQSVTGDKMPPPLSAEPDRREARVSEASHGRERPSVPRRRLGEPSSEALPKSDRAASVAATDRRRFHVQGKPALQIGSMSTESLERASIHGRQRLTTPVVPASTPRDESLDRAVTSAAELEVNTSVTASFRSVPSEAPSATAQAILTPRHSPQPVVHPAAPSLSKPTEPIVHVTIGRVEIRAVSTPAAPKRSAPIQPALSLSDYLERRSGGRG